MRRRATSSSPLSLMTVLEAVAATAGELRRASRRRSGRLALVVLLLFLLSAIAVHYLREAPVVKREDADYVQRAQRIVENARVFNAFMVDGRGDEGDGSHFGQPKDRVRPPLQAPRTRADSVRKQSAAKNSQDLASDVNLAVANAAASAVNATAAATDASTHERFIMLDPEKEQFIYSAHFDDRMSIVHIVGFKHRFKNSATRPLWCRYVGGSDETLHRMRVYFNASVIYPTPGLLYNAFVWRCAVNPGSMRPLSVELVGDDGAAPRATLRVQYTHPPPPPPRHGYSDALLQFGVCVRPMVNYSNLHQLVEFVEVHRLFGVSKFVIYDYTHSPVIERALRHYAAAGLVVVHRWPLPVPLDAVHADGQKAMNHHCLMTYMNVFKYIAFIDLDEILMPIAPARTWSDIVDAIRSSADSTATDGAYVFLSSIFPREIFNYSGLDCDSPKQPCKMATLVNRVHFEIYPVGVWSKPLVEARKTDWVDIHDVRRMMPNYTVADVSPTVAFIRHYRSVAWTSNALADYGAEQFKEDIIREVGAMFAKFTDANVD